MEQAIEQENFDATFELIYNEFYPPIDAILQKMKNCTSKFPNEELRLQKLKRISQLPCTYALIDELDIDVIRKVDNVDFPFETRITNKDFFRCIHITYFAPFLLYARFGYELAANIKTTPENIFNASYQIMVPLKFPKRKSHEWYIQHIYPLTLCETETNDVISHINIYELEKECLVLENNAIDNRFVEATLMQDNKIHMDFQDYLKTNMSSYIEKAFKTQDNKWQMIQLLIDNPKLSNTELGEKLFLGIETINSYNYDIKKEIKRLLGYDFRTLKEAVSALKTRGYLKKTEVG